MNSQYSQPYRELIQLLLDCPPGIEAQIIQKHSNLLNPKLFQLIKETANQQQEPKKAQRLQGIASSIKGMITERFNIYVQGLRLTSESNGNPQVVYPFLQNHVHLLDQILLDVFRAFQSQYLAGENSDDAQAIAEITCRFSYLIQEFSLGDRAINIDIAIAGYQVSLEAIAPTIYPHFWALIQLNLGAAYQMRLRGEKGDNLEKAIVAYEQALLIFSKEDKLPIEWAMVQGNLGDVYEARVKGEKADNLEKAISSYEQALKIYTHRAYPNERAIHQSYLGRAYAERIYGKRVDNLAQAIELYEQALKTLNPRNYPQDWELIQDNLSILRTVISTYD